MILFCSMKITQDVREFARQHSLDETQALEEGLSQKWEGIGGLWRLEWPEEMMALAISLSR
jgi:hypothetical protein